MEQQQSSSNHLDNVKQTIEHPLLLEKYEVIKKIGSGAYGHVWQVRHKTTNEVYAIKKVFLAFQNEIDAQRIYRQISILKKLKHQNVVKLREITMDQNNVDIYLVFEYQESDLFTAIKNRVLNQVHKKYIIYQLAKAVNYLHSVGIVHRDFKPSNILLNGNCHVKICDFGLSRTLHSSDYKVPIMTEFIATRWYRAPEVLFGSNHYSYKSDMWSLGCLIYELYTRRTLLPGDDTISQLTKLLEFKGIPNAEQIKSFRAANVHKILSYFDTQQKQLPHYFDFLEIQEIKPVLIKLLQYSPDKRWSAKQLLECSFLKQFRYFEDQSIGQKFMKLKLNENIKYSINDYKQEVRNLETLTPNPPKKQLTIPSRNNLHRSLHSSASRFSNNHIDIKRKTVNASLHASENTSPNQTKRYGQIRGIYMNSKFKFNKFSERQQVGSRKQNSLLKTDKARKIMELKRFQIGKGIKRNNSNASNLIGIVKASNKENKESKTKLKRKYLKV